MNPQISPSSPPEQAPKESTENVGAESATPLKGPHSATEAERIEEEINKELETEPATLDSVSALFLETQRSLATLIAQSTGRRPPAPPTLGDGDILLSCTLTLRDSHGIVKHLDVNVPVFGVTAPGELPMAVKTLQGILSLTLIRPLTTAWTSYVTSKMERPPLMLAARTAGRIEASGHPETDEEAPTSIEVHDDTQ